MSRIGGRLSTEGMARRALPDKISRASSGPLTRSTSRPWRFLPPSAGTRGRWGLAHGSLVAAVEKSARRHGLVGQLDGLMAQGEQGPLDRRRGSAGPSVRDPVHPAVHWIFGLNNAEKLRKARIQLLRISRLNRSWCRCRWPRTWRTPPLAGSGRAWEAGIRNRKARRKRRFICHSRANWQATKNSQKRPKHQTGSHREGPNALPPHLNLPRWPQSDATLAGLGFALLRWQKPRVSHPVGLPKHGLVPLCCCPREPPAAALVGLIGLGGPRRRGAGCVANGPLGPAHSTFWWSATKDDDPSGQCRGRVWPAPPFCSMLACCWPCWW